MKRLVAAFVLIAISLPVVVFAVGGREAMYVGGTIAGLGENIEGRLETTNETNLVFIPKKTGPPVEIGYAAIKELEYGQKAGRRVGVAIMISPLALLSKKRKHYLTLTFADAQQKEQAAVFELGKDIVRTTLKILEVRSGKELVLQDKEACRQFKSPKECDGK